MLFSFRPGPQVLRHHFPRFKSRTCVFNKPHSRNISLFGRSTNSSVPSVYKPRVEPWFSPTIVLVGFIPVLTFALGTWQLGRLKWKINLIDELQEKLELHPLVLPSKVNLSVLPEFVWRKVSLKGIWDHKHTMIFAPRVREGVHGVHVVTPLLRENGTTVLVNRGFVPKEFAQNMTFSKEEGEVELTGMLRTSQPRNTFTPDNLPEEGQWYWTDVDAMAEYAGGEKANVQPVFVEQIFDGHAGDAAYCLSKGIPVGRPATVDLRNAHLSYVITWYGLSALTSILFARLLMKRKTTRTRQLPRYT